MKKLIKSNACCPIPPPSNVIRKKLIRKQIFCKEFKGDSYNIEFNDLPKDIQDTDIINIHRHSAEHREDYSFTELAVYRMVEETDDEYLERIKENLAYEVELKERRYQTYLKFKAEFEPESKIDKK